MEKNPNNYCGKALVSILTVTFVALMYVNQQSLVYQMGLKVKQNNDVYTKLIDHNKILVYNVLNLRSPVTLEKRLLAKEVELSMPPIWQVVKAVHTPKKFVFDYKPVAKKGLLANR
jgi:hypothetical protein